MKKLVVRKCFLNMHMLSILSILLYLLYLFNCLLLGLTLILITGLDLTRSAQLAALGRRWFLLLLLFWFVLKWIGIIIIIALAVLTHGDWFFSWTPASLPSAGYFDWLLLAVDLVQLIVVNILIITGHCCWQGRWGAGGWVWARGCVWRWGWGSDSNVNSKETGTSLIVRQQ